MDIESLETDEKRYEFFPIYSNIYMDLPQENGTYLEKAVFSKFKLYPYEEEPASKE